jgi:hypothetical protein
MPITSILIVGAIVVAFAMFAAVLAWSEHQTRHWRQSPQSIPDGEPETIERVAPQPHRQHELTAG